MIIIIMGISIVLTMIVTMIRAVEQFQGDRADHKLAEKGVLPVIITVILMIRIALIVITRYHHVQKIAT